MHQKISYLGIPGSYTYIAASKKFSEIEISVPSDSISECIEKTSKGITDFSVVPLENSLNGSITETFDNIIDSGLYIIAEIILHIHHNLLARNNSKISTVYSNPQAINQCKHSLKKYKISKSIFTSDTATAAKIVNESKAENIGALASKLSAELYKLKIIKSNIEDNPNNFTRFAIVSKQKPQAANKTTIVFSIIHKPGSLVSALIPYVHLGLNLTKIESRPVFGAPWEYLFFLDFESENVEVIPELIRLMKKEVNFLKILGQYQKGEIYET